MHKYYPPVGGSSELLLLCQEKHILLPAALQDPFYDLPRKKGIKHQLQNRKLLSIDFNLFWNAYLNIQIDSCLVNVLETFNARFPDWIVSVCLSQQNEGHYNSMHFLPSEQHFLYDSTIMCMEDTQDYAKATASQEHTLCAVWPRPSRQDMHHLVTLCHLFQAKSIFKEQLFTFYLKNNNRNKNYTQITWGYCTQLYRIAQYKAAYMFN